MSSGPSKTTGLRFSLRLGLFYAACFLVGYVTVFATANFLIHDAIEDKEREVVAERLAEYRVWYVAGHTDELRARFAEQSRQSAELMFGRVTGPDVDVLVHSAPRGSELIDIRKLDAMAACGKPTTATIITPKPRTVWTVASTPLPDGLTLQAGRISTPAFEAAATFRRVFLMLTPPGVLLALAGGIFLGYRAMKPVRDLTAAAEAIVKTGDLDRRVDVDPSHRDLAGMGVLFNRMLDRNQRLIRAMRDSLDNVAHDLRTPMARMRAGAEGALATDDGQPDATREALADCLEESDRVLKMLHTLMDIAEAETGVMQLHRETSDLASLIREVIEIYDLVAEERRITIETDLPGACDVQVDRNRMQQAIANLLDNALKYGVEGGRVWISVVKEGEFVKVRVADDGPGIPEQDLPRIWDRLYRGDRSRSQRGLGLGLSFVKAIIDAHGGSVDVRSTPGKGSAFEIRLPAT